MILFHLLQCTAGVITMAGGQRKRKRHRGQRAAKPYATGQDIGGSIFDALHPELLDCILRRAAGHSSSTWKRMSLVNKAFQESAQRCSETLALRRGGQLTKGPLKLRPLQGAEACAALSKELGARARVSRLVLKGDAKTVAAYLPAILEYGDRWISLEVDVPEQKFARVVELLPKLQGSLRRLRISVRRKYTGYSYRVSESTANLDIGNVVRAFPDLESLSIKGPHLLQARKREEDSTVAEDLLCSNLTSLSISQPGVWNLQQALSYLPAACVLNLRSLRVQCAVASPFRLPGFIAQHTCHSPLTQLQALRLDVRYTQTPSDVLLKEVAERCMCLRQLSIFFSPCSSYNPRPPAPNLPNFAEKCPDLERLVISQGGMVARSEFVELSHESGLAVRWSAADTKILILEDGDNEHAEVRCGKDCSVTFFTCIVSYWANSIDLNDLEIRKRAFGKPAAVRKWCDAFCEAD